MGAVTAGEGTCTGVAVAHVVATANFAGTERYAVNLAAGQAARGAHATVVGGDPRRMTTAIAATGAPVSHMEASGLGECLRALARLRKLDVVHAHLTTAEIVATVSFPVPGRRPKVVCTRHIAAHRGSSPGGRALAPWVRYRLDGQMAISRFVADRVDGQSVVIPTGVPDAPLGTHTDKTVLVAQRLEPEKHTEVAVQAWEASGLANEGWQLHIAGSGQQESYLEHLVSRLGLGRSVSFLGQVDDVAERMARAAIFMASAPGEPFGLSVVEAMACGLPVVAAGGGGHLETVGLVPGAALFAPDDQGQAGALLRHLASLPAERAIYGEALRHRQQTDFSLEGFVGRVNDWYQAL